MSWSVAPRCSVSFPSEPDPSPPAAPQRPFSSSGMTMKPNVGHVAALLTACLLGSSAGCQSVQVGGLDMLTSPLSRSFSAIKDAATVNTDQHPDLGQGPSAGERLRLERARNLAETGRHQFAEDRGGRRLTLPEGRRGLRSTHVNRLCPRLVWGVFWGTYS